MRTGNWQLVTVNRVVPYDFDLSPGHKTKKPRSSVIEETGSV